MAAASGSLYGLPEKPEDEQFALAALEIFLKFSSYPAGSSFAELSTLDQLTVLRMARNLKREMGL